MKIILSFLALMAVAVMIDRSHAAGVVSCPPATTTQMGCVTATDFAKLSAKQDANAQLAAIAALNPNDNTVLTRKNGTWTAQPLQTTTAYTPIFTGFNVASYNARYMQTGLIRDIRLDFVTNIAGLSQVATVSIPCTSDASYKQNQFVGAGYRNGVGGQPVTVLVSPGASVVNFGLTGSTIDPLVPVLGNVLATITSQRISVQFSIECQDFL